MSQYLASITLVNGDVTGGTFQAIAGPDVGIFTSTLSGAVPASGGGTSTFLRADGTWTTAGMAPFADNTALVKNSSDSTKQAIVSAASITTGTTRTLTLPDANTTLAGLSVAETFTAVQTFSAAPTAPFVTSGNNERFGDSSGNNSASGIENVFFGKQSGAALTAGSDNAFVGYQSGISILDGNYNAAIGSQSALRITSGSYNTTLGRSSGAAISVGNFNTTLGALADVAANSTVNAVSVGYSATVSDKCTALGATASATGQYSTAIGSGCVNTTNNTVAFNAADVAASTTTTLTVQGNSSTTLRSVARFNTLWSTATDASRAARYYIEVFDTTGRATIGADTDGSGSNVNFFAGSGGGSYGSGRNVIFIQNAAVNPSTNPTSGGILYSNGGAGTWRGSGGTVTAFGPAGPHCGECGYDHWRVACKNDIWGSHLYECGMCGKVYKKGPRSVLDRLSPDQMAEIITE